MENNSNRPREPWRIIVGIVCIVFIVYMWAEKDIAAIYAAVPKEQVASLIAATILVSVMKAAAIAGAVLLIKRMIGKAKKDR